MNEEQADINLKPELQDIFPPDTFHTYKKIEEIKFQAPSSSLAVVGVAGIRDSSIHFPENCQNEA